MKKNNSLLVIGIVSLSLLLILSVIQSSTAQRDDDNDHDKDKWKWNRHDDNDHDKDKWMWNRHDDNDHHHNHDNFELTVRLISEEKRHIPDYKVKVSGETQSIDGQEFEDDGKANVKFYLNDVDNKERVCITNERTDDETCTRFNTDGNEGIFKFYID